MGAKQEAVVRKFFGFFDGGNWPDPATLSNLLAEDVVYTALVPTGKVIRGRAAVQAEFERQSGSATGLSVGIQVMVSNDRHVFVEKVDQLTVGDAPIEHHVVAVFEVDEDGLICAWREYWDTLDVARQVGGSADDVADSVR